MADEIAVAVPGNENQTVSQPDSQVATPESNNDVDPSLGTVGDHITEIVHGIKPAVEKKPEAEKEDEGDEGEEGEAEEEAGEKKIDPAMRRIIAERNLLKERLMMAERREPEDDEPPRRRESKREEQSRRLSLRMAKMTGEEKESFIKRLGENPIETLAEIEGAVAEEMEDRLTRMEGRFEQRRLDDWADRQPEMKDPKFRDRARKIVAEYNLQESMKDTRLLFEVYRIRHGEDAPPKNGTGRRLPKNNIPGGGAGGGKRLGTPTMEEAEAEIQRDPSSYERKWRKIFNPAGHAEVEARRLKRKAHGLE